MPRRRHAILAVSAALGALLAPAGVSLAAKRPRRPALPIGGVVYRGDTRAVGPCAACRSGLPRVNITFRRRNPRLIEIAILGVLCRNSGLWAVSGFGRPKPPLPPLTRGRDGHWRFAATRFEPMLFLNTNRTESAQVSMQLRVVSRTRLAGSYRVRAPDCDSGVFAFAGARPVKK